MGIKKELEKIGFYTFEHVNEKINELKEKHFIEMAPTKSYFDIEKFTVMSQGDFPAHQYHFLIRQFYLTLFETRRMLIEKEENERIIIEMNEKIINNEKKIIIYDNGKKEKYIDLYIKELINRLDLLEIDIANKMMRLTYFERVRLKLIELNNGITFTNEDYQNEEPEYWKWFLTMKAKEQLSQRQTGITEGIWMNIRYLEEPSVLNPEFQVKMLNEQGNLNLNYKKEKELLDDR